jgi:hypothetical protein
LGLPVICVDWWVYQIYHNGFQVIGRYYGNLLELVFFGETVDEFRTQKQCPTDWVGFEFLYVAAFCIVAILLGIRRKIMSHKFKKCVVRPAPINPHDTRVDVKAYNKFKHLDPILADIEYEYSDQYGNVEPDVELTKISGMWTVKRRQLAVSLELLTQISFSETMRIDSIDKVIAERIQVYQTRNQTVVVDRKETTDLESICQDTAIVAFYNYLRYKQRRQAVPFPSALEH